MNDETIQSDNPSNDAESRPRVDIVVDDEGVSEVKIETQPEPEQETPKARAKRLRKLKDDELFHLEDAAVTAEAMVDLARRTQAEFDNYQKRADTQRRQEIKYAASSLIRGLLEPMDNLDRALAEAEKSDDFEALRKGVELTQQQLLEALSKAGATVVDPTNQEFDPEFHDAVMAAAEEDQPNNVVLDTFEKGWKLHERVLRPAKVRVNKLD